MLPDLPVPHLQPDVQGHYIFDPAAAAFVFVPPATAIQKKEGAEKMDLDVCDFSNYQDAVKIGPDDFPYTSGSGITVNATIDIGGTLTNANYNCDGNPYSTSSPAWWIQNTSETITLTFSAPVAQFTMVMNGSNNGEVFSFNSPTGTVTLSNFCTQAFSSTGNQLSCFHNSSMNNSSATGTIVTINNTVATTQYTITHNGAGAGSRITLLDCFMGDPPPVVNPVSNVQACGGDMVSAIAFTGTPGATFNWTNNNTAIGLAASGTGNIASFMAANVTAQQVATITVTPVLGSETGTPITFTITVKPKPTLAISTFNNPTICAGSNGSILFTTTNVPNGIYSVSYTGPGSPRNMLVSGNTATLPGLSAGSYSDFSITINGCSGTAAGPVELVYPSFTWYRDMDGDTFGDPGVTQQACAQPTGYVANNTDCDDNDPLEKPGQVWYADADNDGYSSGVTLTQCLRPAGYKVASELTATTGDCNDNNAAIRPGATEVCDGVDNNCAGGIDEGVLTTYYRDMDGDGFGNPAMTQQACAQPTGYVTNNTDCDDNDALEKPGQVWYADADNDGYSSGVTLTQCLRPAGYKVAAELTATTGDCNDNNAAIRPGATEVCDGVDNNCAGGIDEGVLTTYYRDMDGDGFGNPAMTQQACAQPTGYVTNNTDCDDNDALEKPGQVWYADADNDGYSSGVTLTQCLRPAGYKVASELTATMGDCNDGDEDINPAAAEVCDGIDNNCDGNIDEGVLTTYYRDMDGDGFGNPAMTQQACSQPVGYVTNNTDCDDNDALEKPGQVWYADADNDGYSSGVTLTQCLRPAGYKVAAELTATTGDCNDGDEDINPAAAEVCDGIDNNCDGNLDDGVLTTYYRDMDGDGFGNPAMTQQACSQPVGYVTNNTDCDDNDALEKPGQVWYADADNDGYSSGVTLTQCLRPAGYKVASELTATMGDCNDGDEDINPAAAEVCDGIDNNCDGNIDEGVLTTYYRDMDGDGFGNPAMTQQACSQPVGYVTNNTDCDDNDALEKPGQVWYADADNDGYSSGVTLTQCLRPAGYKVASELTATMGDCNDGDEDINPAAAEVCDGIDNNCDGNIDEGVLTTYYRDMDGDGFGNPAMTQQACSQPVGYVTNNTDCDDNDALEKPGQVWYADADNDGYSSGVTLTQCLRPAGYKVASELTATTGDCNDGDEDINPAAAEVCDGIDNNCDGNIDEGVLTTYYRDMDGDGFGNPAMTQQACAQPTGYVTNNTDCDDNDALEKPGQVWYADADNDGYSSGVTLTQCLRPAGYKVASELTATTGDCNDGDEDINPAAAEVCDGIDNNCDGNIDEGVLTTYYRDMDGDGFGNPAMTQQACAQPTGYVTNNTDCDDNDALEKPGQVWYADADNDGYSSGVTLTQCLRPAGYKVAAELTATTGDCNDGDEDINPAAAEVCDGIDNNCDGNIDEGVLTTYYRDMDGDGFGNPAMTQQACAQPTGYVTNNTDCDDNDPLEKPGQVWYADADNDGYSSGVTLTQCLRPAGYKVASELTATTGDCNDGDEDINPAAAEVCDGIDNNCDGNIDEGVLTTYYRDMDGDGFGDAGNTQQACAQPTGYVTNNTDCDDNDALEKPGQVWYADADNDGYSSGATLTQCLRPAGYKVAAELTATTGDCNDGEEDINPAAAEVCDGIDNNCDGNIDEGVLTTYYRDMDGDGFGNPAMTQQACAQPSGYVTNNTDCDDNDALEKPGQVWYADADNDGYSSGVTLTQCLRPAGYKVAAELTATTGDCNDAEEDINPAAEEVCDGIDNNCDGNIDEGVLTTYYRDMDGDGFGNPAMTQQACAQPTGYVTNNTDCDDNDALEKPGQVWYADADNDGYSSGVTLTQCLRPAGYKVAAELTATAGDCNDGDEDINPEAEEVCDGIDNNCDGTADNVTNPDLGSWQQEDVGDAGDLGSSYPFCEAKPIDVFTLNSTNVSLPTTDNVNFVYQSICGNSSITARVLTVSNGGWAGIMMRESLSPGAKKVVLKTQLSSLIRREIRSVNNGPFSNLQFNRPQHIWLRLERNGSTLTGYTSINGTSWNFAFSANISMTPCIYAGVFSESTNVNNVTTATFDNVVVVSGPALPLAGIAPGLEAVGQQPVAVSFDVFPNPGHGEVSVDLSSFVGRAARIELISLTGQMIKVQETDEVQDALSSLNLSGVQPGIYIMKVRTTDGDSPLEATQRMVVQE